MPAIVDAVLHQKTVFEIGPALRRRASVACCGSAGCPTATCPAYVVDAPYLYRRPGSPYQASDGSEWADNLQRFALLGWVGAHLAAGELDPEWAPQVLHAHDWHAAMACAWMEAHPATAAASVFTVHNLAYQGLFPQQDFASLGLPTRMLHAQGLEFHGQLSFMKAGLKYARRVTTVSPTYAREIATHEFGCGLDGVIRGRGADVSGILNGVDGERLEPGQGPRTRGALLGRGAAGQGPMQAGAPAGTRLEVKADAPLFGVVSRLTAQKGLDLVLAALPALLRQGAQLAVQGSGDPVLEAAFTAAAFAHPGQVAMRIAYDEAMAHRLIGGADVIMVPSRFEPCGLTQLYGLRYGTLPLVRRVGGLADTVVDATEEAVRAQRATGFAFDAATPAALEAAMTRAIQARRHPQTWQRLMATAMAQDFSWDGAAAQYMALYAGVVGNATPRRQ